jgi:hypothetical protein
VYVYIYTSVHVHTTRRASVSASPVGSPRLSPRQSQARTASMDHTPQSMSVRVTKVPSKLRQLSSTLQHTSSPTIPASTRTEPTRQASPAASQLTTHATRPVSKAPEAKQQQSPTKQPHKGGGAGVGGSKDPKPHSRHLLSPTQGSRGPLRCENVCVNGFFLLHV